MASMRPDDTLCYCYHVTLRKVQNYAERERPAVASLISHCLGAGTGCGWCVPYIQRVWQQVMEQRSPELPSAADYEAMRHRYLEDGSRPDLPRVGISSCLLGQAVRWDGGHKLDPVLASLAGCVEWVPVCPEVELGLGVPREPIDLVWDEPGGPVRLVARTSGRDLTEDMRRWAADRVQALAAAGLDGYVLKARSPSCGLRGVPVHPASPGGGDAGIGRGRYAAALTAAFPDLPVAEEGDLADPAAREAFLARVMERHKTVQPGGRT